MGEVLYRGKRIDNNEWITGMPWIFSPPVKKALIVSAMGLVGEDDGISRYCESDEVYPETIGQFTGGVDKTGKKIFSGDIIKTYCHGLPVYTYIIKFYPEHMAFMARCIETNTVNYLCDIRQSAMLIVGNVYDNSELLEVYNDNL